MTLALVSIALGAAAWVMQAHLVASVPAIVIGFVAIWKMKKEPERHDVKAGPWLAVFGIILGACNILLILGVIAFYVFFAVLQISLGF